MKKNVIAVIIAAAAGIAAMFIRTQQLAVGYDAEGLHIPGDGLLTVLIILSVVVAAALFLIAFLVKCNEDVPLKGNAFALALALAGALVLVVYAVLTLMKFTATRNVLNELVFPAFALVAAYCTVVFTAGIFKGHEGKRLSSAGAIPIFFMCFWLILSYRENAIEPVLSRFVFQELAIIFTAIGYCCTVQNTVYGKATPAALAFSAAALFLLILSLADGYSGYGVLLIVYAALETLCSALMARNVAAEISETQETSEE